MCVRSTIQNEECSLPLVRAVMLTKWTSASGHCETQRRTQSGGGVKKKSERMRQNCGHLPIGPGLSDGRVGKSRQVAWEWQAMKGKRLGTFAHSWLFDLHCEVFLAGIKVAWHVLWSCWAGLRGVNEPTSVLLQTRDAACVMCSVFCCRLDTDSLETVHCRKLAGQKYLTISHNTNLPDAGVAHSKRNLVSASPE